MHVIDRNARRVVRLCPVALVWSLAVSCAPAPRPVAPAPSKPAPEAPPAGKLSRDVVPLAYGVGLEIVPSRERFSGHVRIRVELKKSLDHLYLHAKGLQVQKAQAELAGGAVAARFRQLSEDGVARLDFEQALAAGQAVLDLSYDAPFDRQLTGLYKVHADGEDYAFSQFEPVSARQAFPCFDEPAFKTPFDIALTIDQNHKAISNAPAHDEAALANGLKQVRFLTTKPLPTYLVAFMVGPFDVVDAPPIAPNAVRARPLALRGVAVKGKGPRLRYALDHAGPLLAELERYFGIGYPFEKLDLIAVPDFGAGAMENAGAITFREWLLLLDEKSAPESQKRAYANVVAHELAHHWTGDLVTMPWWDDIWLNEAFATFMANHVVRAVHPEYRSDTALLSSILWTMDADSRVSARKIRQPIESTHDIANAFDGITYQKGAGVIGMFERYLGPEIFRQGVQAELAAHPYGVADVSDLVAALEKTAGKNVGAAMGTFLDQAGVPLLETEVRCSGDAAELHLRQSRYLPAGSSGERAQRWQVPVCVRYSVKAQPHESCTLLAETEGSLKLEGCPEWLMPNADGAGYYRFSPASTDFEHLSEAGFAKLTSREKLAFADSLRAGFESGALPAERVFASFAALAADPDRAVAVAPMELLRFAREYLLDEASRPALDRFAKKLYEPRLQKLGWKDKKGEDGDQKLLRAQIISFLGLTLRDPATRASAAQLGKKYLGLPKGTPAPNAVPADLQDTAGVIALQDSDQAGFDLAYKRLLEAKEPTERDHLLTALASVTDTRSEKALALALDPALRVNEAFVPLRYQLGDERTRKAAWQFLIAHLDALIDRVSKEGAGGMPGFAVPFCSGEMATEVENVFKSRIDQLVGGPRSLAAAVESLKLCAAEVEAQRASARAFFAAKK